MALPYLAPFHPVHLAVTRPPEGASPIAAHATGDVTRLPRDPLLRLGALSPSAGCATTASGRRIAFSN
jgi:hypothetical protein